jgi:hypothetical protein
MSQQQSNKKLLLSDAYGVVCIVISCKPVAYRLIMNVLPS